MTCTVRFLLAFAIAFVSIGLSAESLVVEGTLVKAGPSKKAGFFDFVVKADKGGLITISILGTMKFQTIEGYDTKMKAGERVHVEYVAMADGTNEGDKFVFMPSGATLIAAPSPPPVKPSPPATPSVPQAPTPSKDVIILVASADTAAAEAQANGVTVFAEPKLFKAFDLAAAKLDECHFCKVTVKVAGGPQVGKGRVGQWTFPEVNLKDASLHILGGWNADFSKRQPLSNPTVLVASAPRTRAFVTFRGASRLSELVFSGFAIDASAGNKYDKKANSLLQKSSPQFPLLEFKGHASPSIYVALKRLIIADNVFINAPNGAGAPAVQPQDGDSEVIVRNNLFVGSGFCFLVTGLESTARYVVEGNSFIGNASSAGMLAIQPVGRSIEITGNLFAYNAGGAIRIDFEDKAGPPIAIEGNLFWRNAPASDPAANAGGAILGKFNNSADYLYYTAEEAAGDFSWKIRNNVVEDPDLAITVAEVIALGTESPKTAEKETEEKSAAKVDIFGNSIGGEEKVESDGSEGSDAGRTEESAFRNFAPLLKLDLAALPFPRSAKAKKYGASAERVQ